MPPAAKMTAPRPEVATEIVLREIRQANDAAGERLMGQHTISPWIFVVLRVLRDKSYEGMNAPERGHDRPGPGPWIGFIRTAGGRNRC
jgi:hypothetical protein